MYLNAQQLVVANHAVVETFETTSIAWQAIPHWDTGDPAQSRVPVDDVKAPATVMGFTTAAEEFDVTIAEVVSPTLEVLLSQVIEHTVALARKVDDDVMKTLHSKSATKLTFHEPVLQDMQDALIDARADVESSGFRAPSCLITDTAGVKSLSSLALGVPLLEPILQAANINSLHRAETVGLTSGGKAARGIVVGRRRRIPHGGAAEASPGEEPVDIAVSVPPSLECVGENTANEVAFTLRITYALRVKDAAGVVGFLAP